CGVKDVSAKMLGSNNKMGAVVCTINALKKMELKAESKEASKEEDVVS
ncbi:30S ribosomal protein S5, partial [Patescibacteria group bacterium]|nr:30S ribosomal protein S5 [Patescibacteria group bacterium]